MDSSDLFYRINAVNQDLANFSNISSVSTPPANNNNYNMLSTNNNHTDAGGSSSFDPMLHARLPPAALDPNSFSAQFILPRFAAGGAAAPGGYARTIVEPSDIGVDNYKVQQPSQPSLNSNNFTSTSISNQIIKQQSRQPSLSPFLTIPSISTANSYLASSSSSSAHSTSTFNSTTSTTPTSSIHSNATASSSKSPAPTPDLNDAVYAPYGSSIVSINPAPFKPTPPYLSSNSSFFNSKPPSSPSSFSPEALGLPIPPPPGTSTNFAGLYSSSGFDVLSVLARVANRANPVINIGPVDTSCAFLVVDARKWDNPIVFASETFSKLTGYGSEEIIGRNCRFLQSPDGIVAQGSARKYTDPGAAYHMKMSIAAGKESQYSLINYMKGGKPFINLTTIMPITWDTEEIAYYVGFQVDLVDQPNAILDRMKDGTYVVNYSLLNNPPPPKLPPAKERQLSYSQSQSAQAQQASTSNSQSPTFNPTLSQDWSSQPQSHSQQSQIQTALAQSQQQNLSLSLLSNPSVALDPNNLLSRTVAVELSAQDKLIRDIALIERVNECAEVVGRGAMMGVGVGNDLLGSSLGDEEKKNWSRLLLDNVDDFIHVISLKGNFLFASPSSSRILEYESSELLALTLPNLLHPADVVPVMRQLKEAGTTSNLAVSLLYRIRRKKSGWVWIEAKGRMHIEPGKGRKCIILTARPQEVYQMSWGDLRSAGGLGEAEFWIKLSEEGMVLSCTKNVQSVLGFLMEEMVGTSIFQLIKSEQAPVMRNALIDCSNGKAVSVRYLIKSRRGYVDVVSRFYPRPATIEIGSTDVEFDVDRTNRPSTHLSIIAQTNEYSSEQRKLTSSYGAAAPSWTGAVPIPNAAVAPALTTSELSDPLFYAAPTTTSTSTPFTSIFKTLVHPSTTSDNAFDELDVTRCTSWQFELHQLQTVNRQLKEEKEVLLGRKLLWTEHLNKKRTAAVAFTPTPAGAGENGQKSGSTHGKGGSDGGNRSKRGGSVSKHGSEGGASSKSTRREGGCANCGRLDSPEWRAGPTGIKSLCNACGLRWAKAQRGSSAGSALSNLSSLTANNSTKATPATASAKPSSSKSKSNPPPVPVKPTAKTADSMAIDPDGLSPASPEDAASPVAWR